MKRFALGLLAAVTLLNGSALAAEPWAMKDGPLMTRFAKDVKPESPLPEYPRPQLTREAWQNLNGLWQYKAGAPGDAVPTGQDLGGQILVPFPVESAISGVMRHHDRLWYRRTFTVPADWAGKRIILHFGAVDYESEIIVNGKSLGTHVGGYDSFSYDVTDALSGTGEQELIVRVFDPTKTAGIPRGKQTLTPGGIMYTSTTGIWQTVWLEPVTAGGIEKLIITPDVDAGTVTVTVKPMGQAAGGVNVAVRDGDKTVGIARGGANQPLVIKVPDAKLWSPDTPFLYDISASVLGADDRPVDTVKSYFGMRKISVGEIGGIKKILLNNQFTFLIGPLDQGFWPDGLYTAPTDEALRYDIQATKDMGFNFIRKHIKVEPARWYYHADKIGLMVWQDMPSANSYDAGPNPPPVDKAAYKHQLTRMVEQLQSVPCIIMWVTFNEGQGQHDTKELVALVKQLDPTRLVNQASGGGHEGAGDIFDTHPYPAPQMPKTNEKQVLAIGEFGGIGLTVPGHLWKQQGNDSYTMSKTPEEVLEVYAEYTQALKKFRDESGLSAAVYTQTTDVETEVNGLLTYDRVPKVDLSIIAKANRFEIPAPVYTPVVPTSEKDSQTWKYTTQSPHPDWKNERYDDSKWTEGKGGFGVDFTPNIGQLGTPWNTTDIWLRRTFTLPELTTEQLGRVMIMLHHDEDVVVYINGVLAYEREGFDNRYVARPIRPAALRALKPKGENVMAVHCEQTVGGQYIDVGLTLREPAPTTVPAK